MKIKLTGELDTELTRIGLKPGDVVTPESSCKKTGAMYFFKLHIGFSNTCVVWPENYEIINEDNISQSI